MTRRGERLVFWLALLLSAVILGVIWTWIYLSR